MLFRWREKARLRVQVETLLSQTYHTPVVLAHPQYMPGRSNVCRFAVREGPEEIGRSLVVKRQHAIETDRTLAASYPSARYRFFNEWAGLQFLTQETRGDLIGPRFYAADRANDIVVMEDLKPARDGSACLKGKDPGRAEEALVLWSSVLGRLHASTTGKGAIFTRIRENLAPRQPSWGWVPHWQRTPAAYTRLLQTLPEEVRQTGFASFQWMHFVLRQATDTLALTVSPQVTAELEIVIQALREPGPFLAYTHGDPCPGGNYLIAGNRSRLVDFENGDYRHALCDAVYARMCMPTCWDAQQLPHRTVLSVEQAYRTALVKGCPEAEDERRFAQELVHACAYWALMLGQFGALTHFPMGDAYWQPYRMCQRILTRFERFAETTEEFGYLEALGSLFATMAGVLRQRWPAHAQQLPVYPAFQKRML